MAFELPRQAFEHARNQTEDAAMRVVIDGLIHMLAETEQAIVALKLEVARVKQRLDRPDE